MSNTTTNNTTTMYTVKLGLMKEVNEAINHNAFIAASQEGVFEIKNGLTREPIKITDYKQLDKLWELGELNKEFSTWLNNYKGSMPTGDFEHELLALELMSWLTIQEQHIIQVRIRRQHGKEYSAIAVKAFQMLNVFISEAEDLDKKAGVVMGTLNVPGFLDLSTDLMYEMCKGNNRLNELLHLLSWAYDGLAVSLKELAARRQRRQTAQAERISDLAEIRAYRANAKAAKLEAQAKVNAERQARFALEKAIKEATKQLNALYTLLNQCDDNQVAGLLIDIQTQQELVNSLYK